MTDSNYKCTSHINKKYWLSKIIKEDYLYGGNYL
jgi:hypothetical protein